MTKDEIRELRERLGLNQEQFGNKIGVHFITISRWERGISAPHPVFIAMMQKLSSEVKVDV
jgi:putative transcriptional regulator